jgi:hypothetical protein
MAAWSTEFIKITGAAPALLMLIRSTRSRAISASQAGVASAAEETRTSDAPRYPAMVGALKTAPGIP